MTEPAETGQPFPRAFLRVGGNTIARHQLTLALALDCQRVICIARDLSPDLIALQHVAEDAGVQFNVVPGARALLQLVTGNDELLVLNEGLLVEPRAARGLLEGSHRVLVQPIETGLSAGFERLDINHAAAGAMRVPGRLVERLAELPGDCDVPSALTRIALQAGVPTVSVPAAVREGARWRLIRSEHEAHASESGWIRLHMGDEGGATPGRLLARFGVRSLGPALLHAGSGSRITAAATIATMLLALGSGWLRFGTAGFLFCGLAWVLLLVTAKLARVERDSLDPRPMTLLRKQAAGWVIDIELILIVMWNTPARPGASLEEQAFAPIMLLCLVRLLPRALDRHWTGWVRDRLMLTMLLAFAGTLGALGSATQLLAVVLALAGILIPRSKARLT